MRHRISICKAVLLLVSMPSLGAELFYMDHDPVGGQYVGPIGPLVVSGEIVPGDYDRLLSKILDDQNRFLAQNKIILASDGGDVAEALKIAKLLKSLLTEVIVGPLTGRCVSACFFIYAAAGQRETDGERLIGINRPYLADPDAVSAPPVEVAGVAVAGVESQALTQVRAFLRENAVPTYLVDEMFRRASDEVYWLSADDEKNLGYKSASFQQYLRTQCAWDEDFEREANGGKRSMDDMKLKWKCRDRVIQSQAREALILASKEKLLAERISH
jgi:hypothetical protein